MKEKFSGYRVAVATAMYLFVAMGGLGILSIFIPSLCAENGFTLDQISVMSSCAGLGSTLIGMFVTPTLLKKFQPRGCMIIASVLICGHLLWYSFATKLWELYVAATLGGFAIGIGTMAAAGALISNWFVEKRAQVTGIVMACSNLGGAAFQAVCGSLIDSMGYRMTYRVVVAFIFVVAVIAMAMIRNKPEDVGEKPLGFETLGQTAATAGAELPGLTAKEAMKTASFWFAFAGICIGTLTYMSCLTYFVTVLTGEGYGMTTASASIYAAALGLVAAGVLMLNGKIQGKLGYARYIGFGGIVTAIGALVFGLTGPALASMPWLIIIAIVCLSVGASRRSADAQTATAICYGLKDFATIQAYFTASATAGTILMAFVTSAMISAGLNTDSFYVVYAVLALVSMACLIAAGITSPMKKAAEAK